MCGLDMFKRSGGYNFMDRKQKIKLLNSYYEIEKSIADLQDRYEELYTASTKITPSYGKEGSFGGGFDGSKVENNCIKLLEISQKIEAQKELHSHINKALRKLNYSQRKLLEYVSIENHTIYQATKYFKRGYSNTKTSFDTAIAKIDL